MRERKIFAGGTATNQVPNEEKSRKSTLIHLWKDRNGKQSCEKLVFSAMKKTLVLGATPNPGRYAYLAMHALTRHGHEAVPVGIRAGEVAGIPILKGMPAIPDIDTVTLYVGPQRQVAYYDYILSLRPRRIIFNPGTENPELEARAEAQGIEIVEGCTLVMLSIGAY